MKAEFDFETKTVMLNSGYEMPINGLGTYSLHGDECINSVKSALSNGVRLIDTASAYGNEEEIGQAVREAIDEGIIQREDIFVTTKIYPGREMENPEQSIQACLDRLDIGYVDYGFVHCLDEEKDWQAYQEGGALAYLLELKKQRVVRHIGLSSHTPGLVTKVLDAGIVDQLMFSINPGYDYRHGDYANGSTEERMAMYRKCEADGVGISVMKPFSGGQLLDDKTSPFGKALTRYQCIQYALNKPGVLTVLPGIRSVEDVNIMTWRWQGIPWQPVITGTWKRKPLTAWPAVIVTGDALSM